MDNTLYGIMIFLTTTNLFHENTSSLLRCSNFRTIHCTRTQCSTLHNFTSLFQMIWSLWALSFGCPGTIQLNYSRGIFSKFSAVLQLFSFYEFFICLCDYYWHTLSTVCQELTYQYTFLDGQATIKALSSNLVNLLLVWIFLNTV